LNFFYPLPGEQYLLKPKPMTPVKKRVRAAPRMPARDLPVLISGQLSGFSACFSAAGFLKS